MLQCHEADDEHDFKAAQKGREPMFSECRSIGRVIRGMVVVYLISLIVLTYVYVSRVGPGLRLLMTHRISVHVLVDMTG